MLPSANFPAQVSNLCCPSGPLPNTINCSLAGPQQLSQDALKQTEVRPASGAPPTQSPQASGAPATKKPRGSTRPPAHSTHGEIRNGSTSEDPASDTLYKSGGVDSGPTALELAYLDARLRARASTERVLCCFIASLFVIGPIVVMTLYYFLFCHFTL